MKYLVKTVETFRVATETEAKQIIEDAKKDKHFSLTKYLSEYKEQKQKGEVIDSWYRITLTKEFNEEKSPESYVEITYETEPGAFPDPVDSEDEE